MKIVVTGVAGFLGSHIADALIKNEHEVCGVDDMSGGDQHNVPNYILNYDIKCQDTVGLNRIFKGADAVYHCAALAHEGLSVFSPHLITDSVYGASVSVMSAACQQKVPLVINMSSMARYGDAHGSTPPFIEEMVCTPVDPYGQAKLFAEKTMNLLGQVHGVRVVHCVPHNIIGPRQKYDDPYRNVVSIMINKMIQGQQPVIYGDGSQTRCFSYYEDDLQVMLKMLTADIPHGEVFNVGPDENPTSVLELAKIIAEELTFRLDPIFVPDRPCEVKAAHCSADKIRKWFGYKTEWTLRDGIKEMIKWQRELGRKPFKYHLPLEIINEKTPKTWTEKKI